MKQNFEERFRKFRGYCEYATGISIIISATIMGRSFIFTLVGIILFMFGAWDLSK